MIEMQLLFINLPHTKGNNQSRKAGLRFEPKENQEFQPCFFYWDP